DRGRVVGLDRGRVVGLDRSRAGDPDRDRAGDVDTVAPLGRGLKLGLVMHFDAVHAYRSSRSVAAGPAWERIRAGGRFVLASSTPQNTAPKVPIGFRGGCWLVGYVTGSPARRSARRCRACTGRTRP